MAAQESVQSLLGRMKENFADVVSLLVFFGATALIFRSLEFALVVTASLGFHELGHAAALLYNRLSCRISFNAAGAMTWSSLRERARLSQAANTYVHLAGPFFSLLLALIALGLHAAWQPSSHHLLILANFSAQVGFLNLLPLGPITDGGKIFKRMAASLDGISRKWAVVLPIGVTALMLTLYALVEMNRELAFVNVSPIIPVPPFILGLLLIGLWMAVGLVIETWHAPRVGMPPKPMTARQAFLLLVLIWDILVFYLIVIYATPFWLAPEYLLGTLKNLAALAYFIGRVL